MRINKRFQEYIDGKNWWAKITKKPTIEFPLTQENVTALAHSLSSDLSPENLHCDGEISVAEAQKKGRKLQGVVKDLTAYAAKNNLSMPAIYY